MTSDERKEYMRKWRLKHKAATRIRNDKWRKANPDRVRAYGRKFSIDHPESQMLSSARERATKLGLPFSIKKEDIIIPEFCPILGIKLERIKGIRGKHSPSLDRVIPELGYVKGNIQVMSDRANRIKNDGTAEEHEKIAKYMREFSERQQ